MLAVEYQSSPGAAWQTHLSKHTDEFEAVAEVLDLFDHPVSVRVVPLRESQVFLDAQAELDECRTMDDVDAVLEQGYRWHDGFCDELRGDQERRRGLNVIRFPTHRRVLTA